ncbi:TetR/AcrR family transcriptional regulator [Mycobacterium sp.]|uniref:TetR/AcrR family transcriptional regulator n=1 Tax=Mycobacterium sp. TaxID=1785 RepID=UPI003C74006C
MSESVSLESTRRRLTAKQADTIQRLNNAALAVLAREGFGGLTIRLVAAEAGVGAATAYTYFSSKEHLVAEVFWRRLASSVPPPIDDQPLVERVIAVLRHIALLVADEPEFAGAVTNALLGRDPDVEHLRDRIAREIRGRLVEAAGEGTDPALVETLELLYTGALVHAGMGYVTYSEIADRLERSARLLLSA